MYKEICQCRVCGNSRLDDILDLGEQYLSGIFPKSFQKTEKAPLKLVKCSGEGNFCGLVQLKHTADLALMYGDNYGYRSGLNPSMVQHLQAKVDKLINNVPLEENDVVLDIGSNDCTTLKCYPDLSLKLVGVDPSGKKFEQYYPEHVTLIPDFFTSENLPNEIKTQKAKIITSFSMFYDLEDPVIFAQQIKDVLHQDGVWVLEQSYMPLMLEQNAFDTICHEHLEYYGLSQIKWIMDQVGLKIIDVEFNNINGGSFSIVVTHEGNKCYAVEEEKIQAVINKELAAGLKDSLEPYQMFAQRIHDVKKVLLNKINEIIAEGKSIFGLGASTKGNTTLQYFELMSDKLPYIGEVNSDKYGCVTPGTNIPIIAENELINKNPDYLLVLPWHFRSFFEKSNLFKGIKLIFPLPTVEVVNCD